MRKGEEARPSSCSGAPRWLESPARPSRKRWTTGAATSSGTPRTSQGEACSEGTTIAHSGTTALETAALAVSRRLRSPTPNAYRRLLSRFWGALQSGWVVDAQPTDLDHLFAIRSVGLRVGLSATAQVPERSIPHKPTRIGPNGGSK